MSTTTNLDATVERLRNTKGASDDLSYERGFKRGVAWVRDIADYTSLQFFLSQVEEKRAASRNDWGILDLPAREGVEMKVAATRMHCRETILNQERYVEGFVEGGVDLWHHVEDQVN